MGETTKFVILGTQRTGTTLIRTSLDSHPDVQCSGEVFNLGRRPYRADDGFWKYSTSSVFQRIRSRLNPQAVTSEYLQNLFNHPDYSAIGFKFMLSHSIARPYIFQMLKQHNAKAILVIRRNALKTLISRKIAASSGVYHVSKTLGARSAVENWKRQKITLDCQTLTDELQDIVDEVQTWRDLAEGSLEMTELIYEDYLRDQDKHNEQLQKFLNLKYSKLNSDLKKVNADKLEQLVVNHEDVRKVLLNTDYSEFLT